MGALDCLFSGNPACFQAFNPPCKWVTSVYPAANKRWAACPERLALRQVSTKGLFPSSGNFSGSKVERGNSFEPSIFSARYSSSSRTSMRGHHLYEVTSQALGHQSCGLFW